MIGNKTDGKSLSKNDPKMNLTWKGTLILLTDLLKLLLINLLNLHYVNYSTYIT